VLIPESQRVSLTLDSTSERELAIRGEIASNLKKMCWCVFKIKHAWIMLTIYLPHSFIEHTVLCVVVCHIYNI